MNPKLKVVIAMLIYGSLGVFVTRVALPTACIVFVRAALGALTLFLVCLAKGKLKNSVPARTFLLLLGLGALIGINWLLLFDAYKYTYVSTATLLYYTQPVFVIILSTIFIREKLTKRKAIGVILAIAGMILINGVQLGGSDPRRGMLLSLGAALLYAIIMLTNKANKGIEEADGLVLTVIQMFGAALIMAIYVFSGYQGEFRGLDSKSILFLVILGVVHTALAYYLYFTSVKEIDAQNLAILGYIDPASSIFFSAVFLGERLTALQLAGAALIIGGALYSQLGTKK